MAAVVSGLLASPLAERYALESITTHRAGSALERIGVALRGGVQLLVWCARHPRGLVHIHAAVRGSLHRKACAILIARAFRCPVLLQVHAGPGDLEAFADRLGPLGRGFLRASMRRAQAVVSVSEASASALADAFDLGEVGVIPNAAPAGPARVGPGPADAALFLGGFDDPAKGGVDLVRALPSLLQEAPALRIQLAGPGEAPPELERLLGERVCWSGWLDPDQKARALEDAAMVVLPSRSEGLPVVLLEAMVYGRAVVATRVGGIPELIDDDVDGVIIAPGDQRALIAACAGLTGDAARLTRLGAAARRRVAELDEHSVVERLDALYRGLLPR